MSPLDHRVPIDIIEFTHVEVHIAGKLGLIPQPLEDILCSILSNPSVPLSDEEFRVLSIDIMRVLCLTEVTLLN